MEPSEFTLLLRDWSNGDRAALDALTPIVYQELRKLAGGKMNAENPDHTLRPTALVHEAYLRLVQHNQKEWHSRAHFFAVASHLMRQILVDHARKRNTSKRGGGRGDVSLDDAVTFAPEGSALLVALDDGLRDLANVDERKSKILELKYFTGLQGDEIAEALGVSLATVTRETRLATAWLARYISGDAPAPAI